MSAVETVRPRGAIAAYLLHLRPAEWPVMAAHTALGWWLATGFRVPDRDAWLGIGAWVVLLNGGTLALNSAFDRDEGDIAFLRRPPPAPRGLAGFALLLIVLGLVATASLSARYRGLYLICAAMSVAYSVPPLRFKSVAGMDWLINMLGFGTLTPYAAWAITGRPLHGPLAAVLWSFTPLFAGLYPLTQLYQVDDDRARGDRTLAVRLGPRHSLTLAVLGVGVAFGMLAMAAWRSPWLVEPGVRWAALGVAGVAWLIVLAPWHAHAREWSTRQHQSAMYHALAAWALTDIAVLLAWAT